jgi:hypothetical protein
VKFVTQAMHTGEAATILSGRKSLYESAKGRGQKGGFQAVAVTGRQQPRPGSHRHLWNKQKGETRPNFSSYMRQLA